MSIHTEATFEGAIEQALVTSGWAVGQSNHYRRDIGVDTAELFAFVGATQPQRWDKLRQLYGLGDDADKAQRQFAERVAKEIDGRGTLEVLRHGVKDRGVTIDLAYFRPAHSLAEETLAQYDRNRLTVTRQLRYSSTTTDELDLALFVNGLPVATAELKNQLTGQNAEHAKQQYRADRDPKELLFAKRALVHFAVDQDLVFLTTRLTGKTTRFLPFNQGSEGPGVSGGAGNPAQRAGAYRTSYLWDEVWQRDAWLDLLRRFAHLEPGGTSGKKLPPHQRTLIFPRYHQWHAVRRLADDASHRGSGHNYLVMHSAGSGKSNTIAWLAHRLAGLHTPAQLAADAPPDLEPETAVFDKVVVITDRSVLDRQLQDTIYQFEHQSGVVTKVNEHGQGSKSEQVAAALAGETAKIVIVTLQTFPYVLEKLAEIKDRRYAVIVDEAHSSQTGEAAAKLKQVLVKLGSDDVDEDGDPLTASALARGKHRQLSYFAFTATPKAKTVELFGTPRASDGQIVPFHVYSMRQAIEEGFILDVLASYVTYKTYWKLANENPDDPEVDPRKASAALARFAELQSESMQQRAELIVEHFHQSASAKVGGRAKAMVVTRSREHAVRLFRAIREYVDMRGYTDCGALVAFSGELEIDGQRYTEKDLTTISETGLPQAFAFTRVDDPHAMQDGKPKPEYRILVVAEKYQTGFDQPLLTTMYVDKPLKGVAAVQTLSRLNRTHPHKSQDDVFVLDLANEAEDVQDAFRPYFEAAATAPTDPNLLYTVEQEVMGHQLLVESEMDAFVAGYLDAQQNATTEKAWQAAHAALYRHTDPPRDRFAALLADNPEQAEEFRAQLRDFVRKYGFLSQVVTFTAPELERLYLYGKHLLPRLPRPHEPGVDIGAVDLTHLRISKTGDHMLSLGAEGEQTLPGFSGGTGAGVGPEKITLSELIDEFNAKYGTGLDESDLLEPIKKVVAEPKVAAAAQVNSFENFGHVFDDPFSDEMIERLEDKTEALRRFADDEDFKAEFTKLARRRAFEMLRGVA